MIRRLVLFISLFAGLALWLILTSPTTQSLIFYPEDRGQQVQPLLEDTILQRNSSARVQGSLREYDEETNLDPNLTWSISGRVMDQGGYQVPGVEVFAYAVEDCGFPPWPAPSGVSGDGGYYSITELVACTYGITTSEIVLVPAPVTVPPDATGIDVIVSGNASSIRGRITDSSGNPVAGVTVSVSPWQMTNTDLNGDYTLHNLTFGSYTITPSKSGYAFSPPSRTVTVPPDATGQDFSGATALAVEIDVTLYSDPTTDNERAPYENIMRHFADGLYEAANGAHKLGTVTFHPSGADANTADIVWVEECHPSASPAGFGTDGLHINMCDIFTDGSGQGNDYDFMSDEAHQVGGGYTLAHEWGHYYYGLYDEYVGDGSYDHIFQFPHSTDEAVMNSIMNSQWNARDGNYDWLNFSVSKNDTRETAQFRVYTACGWDTLVRPVTDDPRDGDRVALPVRLYHSELVDAAPSTGQDAPIDLPGSARSNLSFVWEASATSPVGPRSSRGIPYTAQLASTLGQNLSYPDPIVLLAFVHTDLAIAHAGVQASVELPDGTIMPVAFADDGVAPDALAGDGLYSALAGYETNGVYTFEVQFENNAGLATFVPISLQPSIGANGQAVPLADPTPIGENFAVSKTMQVEVSNVASDDHGNTLTDATAITANNAPHTGKIDYAADRDVFQFATLESGHTYVRVTNLALGMEPHLRILGPDQSTVLFDITRDPTCVGYLFTPLLGVSPGTTVYAEVSHTNSGAAGGLYEFSAGARVVSDIPSCHYIYLPYVGR